mgnify:CR=1 FL=1
MSLTMDNWAPMAKPVGSCQPLGKDGYVGSWIRLGVTGSSAERVGVAWCTAHVICKASAPSYATTRWVYSCGRRVSEGNAACWGTLRALPLVATFGTGVLGSARMTVGTWAAHWVWLARYRGANSPRPESNDAEETYGSGG